jgi:SAM-dependent methyltransferase
MDATSLEFDSDTFDVGLMLDVVEHLHPPILEKVLQEVGRVLKPGGKLIIHTVPNKWVVKPARLAMRIMGIPSETDRHVNEQSLFTLRNAVRPFYLGNVWIERTKGFWSFWGKSSNRAQSQFIVFSLRALDFLLDNRCVSLIIKLPPLRFFFGTDIWAELTPKK